MLTNTVLVFLVSLITLFLSIGATPPSSLNQGSRRPGYWPRPSTHDHPYKPDYPHRPGYPQRPGYPPHRPDYPQRPSYPGSHDVYPEEDCKYGRPCGDAVDEDFDPTGDETEDDLGGFGDDYEDDQSGRGQLGCSCLLYVGYTVVFRRVNNVQRFSCNRYGLERCSRYCHEMFQEEDLRDYSRQDACDVIGREIYTPWYRKDQVCGSRGPYRDTPLPNDLCCKRGRPSLDCEEDLI